MLLALIAHATAGTLVLHASPDSRVALAHAAAAMDVKADTLSPATFADLAVGKPAVLRGPGRAEACTTATGTTAAVQLGVDRAERAIDYLEFEKALANLQVATTALGCLAEPLDRDLAARALFLLGYTLGQQGDLAAARESFARARSLKPALKWDTNLPPDLEPTFQEASKDLSGAAVQVALTPAPTAGQLYVDGVSMTDAKAPFTLTPGRHLVQVLGLRPTVAWVTVRGGVTTVSTRLADAGTEGGKPPPSVTPPPATTGPAATTTPADKQPTNPLATAPAATKIEAATTETPAAAAATGTTYTLVLPGLIPVEAVNWAGSPAQRADLGTLLATMLDREETIFVLTDTMAYRHVVGTDTWEARKIPASAFGGIGRETIGRSLLYGGAAVAVGGAAMLVEGWIATNSAASAGDAAENFSDYNAAQQDYASASGRYGAGWLVTGGAALMLTGGAGLAYLGAPAVPWGAGFTVRNGW